MKASEASLYEFITKSNTKFVIPVYQRNYDWTDKHCKVLLNDIKEAGRKKKKHFIGSIVYVNDDIVPITSVKELIIVDGQQRLTTIILIYLRLYKLAGKLNDKALEEEIFELCLINKHAKVKNEEEKIKLKPTENNDKALKYIYKDNPINFKGKSNIIDNYIFFENNITENN